MNNPGQEIDKIKLRLVEKLSEIGGWTWDAKRDCFFWSERAEEILGSELTRQIRTLNEFIGAVQADDQKDVLGVLESFRQGLMRQGSCTYQTTFDDGESRYLTSHIQAEYSESGELLYLVGTVQDTTAKAQLEKTLLENAMKVRLALDVTPVILFMQDQSYRFTWVKAKSPEAKSRLVGCSDGEVFGDGAVTEQLKRLKDKAFYFNRRISEEMRLSFWGERRRLYNVIVEPVETGASGEREIIGAFIDLTEREEKEILRREQERVRATQRARTEFISYLAHEIKTPLNHIIGFADLLKEDICGSEKETVIDHLGVCVQQLRDLMEDYLDLAKLDKGRFEVELEPVALVDLVNDLIRSHGLTARKKGLLLASSIDVPSDAIVFLDKQKIRQILSNLLSNALKYTEQGDIGVHVSLSSASGRQAVTARIMPAVSLRIAALECRPALGIIAAPARSTRANQTRSDGNEPDRRTATAARSHRGRHAGGRLRRRGRRARPPQGLSVAGTGRGRVRLLRSPLRPQAGREGGAPLIR